MKTTKSKHVDYYKLYNTALAAITFCFLYIEINFFLSLGHFLSFFFLILGLIFFCFYLSHKNRPFILIALGSTVLSLALNFIPIF